MYLLDTNCFIYSINDTQQEFCNWSDSLDNSEIFLSNLVFFELLTGYYDRNNKKIVNLLFEISNNLNTIEYTFDDAILSAKIKSQLKKSGIQNKSLDYHIASQAINNSLTLVTFNAKDFNSIKGLKIKSFNFVREK